MDATGVTGPVTASPGPGESPGLHWWAGHEDALPGGVGWLSGREQARLDGMHFTKRRTEYLLRRWVGKRAVAARAALEVGDDAALARVEVLNRVTGAPYVSIDGAVTPWEISLSDRAGCAVCVIGTSGAGQAGSLGVDLEVVEPRSVAFVGDFLTPAEQEWVSTQAAGDDGLGHDAAANLVWSAKEAVLKVLQVGLRADTRWVEVAVPPGPRRDGWARFTASWRDGRVLPGWWRRDGVFLLTVCAHEDLDPPRALPGATDVARAVPVHSWVDRPVVRRGEGRREPSPDGA